MASFTDEISKFNPYVAQLPVEAMKQVGMAKQAQYDQGVQKIQGYIDNIAGMDVYRPQDKNLIQSKLGELNGKLKIVAAGDFSNAQLVNSVGGMATSIIKDPLVQNAVSSTASYKKAMEERKAYQKDGKTSPSNDLDLKKRHDNWLNGGDDASFSGGYEPYTNWKKNGLEILKSLTGDSTLTEEAFTPKIDPATGKPVLNKEGKPIMVVADAITLSKYKGLTPEKIYQALQVGLSPADFKQMELDGMYSYDPYKTPEQVRGLVQGNFDNKRKIFLDKRKTLEALLPKTSDAGILQNIRENIAELDKYISGYNNQQSKIMKYVDDDNLDAAKANLFTIDALSDFSSAFSYKELEQGYKTSALADMAMRREIRDQEHREFVMKLNNDNYWSGLNYKLKLREVENDEKATGLMLGGLLSDIPQEDLPKVTTGKVVSDLSIQSKTLDAKDEAFLKSHGGKDKAWLQSQREAWEARPNGVDADVAEYFTSTELDRRNIEVKGKMISDISKAADAKFGTIDQYVPARAPIVRYSSPSLNTTYTSKDFTDFVVSADRFTSIRTAPGLPATIDVDEKGAKENMSPKEYILWRAYHGLDSGKAANDLAQNVKWYRTNVYNPFKDRLKQKNDYVSKEVYGRISVGQGVDYTFPTATPAQKSSASGFLLSAATLANAQSGRLPGSDGTADDLKEIASDLENVNIKVSGGTEYQPTAYRVTALGKAGKTVSFTLSPEQKRGSMGGAFDATPAAQAAMPYIEPLKYLGGQTTATDGSLESNQYNSFMSNVDFPNVKTYGIKSNLVKRGDGYGFRLSIYNPTTKTWMTNIPYPAGGAPAMSAEDITKQRLGFNDAVLYELINDKPATARDLQIIKNASKNPF